MSMFELFVFVKLLPFINGVGLISTLMSILGLGVILVLRLEDSIGENKFSFYSKRFIIGFIIGMFLSLSPNKDQAMIISGGYAITNVENIGDVPVNLIDALISIKEDREQ